MSTTKGKKSKKFSLAEVEGVVEGANDTAAGQAAVEEGKDETASQNIFSRCRFYEKKTPDVEDLVVVNVRHIAEMGAYVRLLEYNNIEGMILMSELSRRRIRSIHKLLRVGKNEVVMVIRKDIKKDKEGREYCYIDLSKRRVSPEDIVKAEDRFNKAKIVHGIMRHVAERTNQTMEQCYEKIGWPLYRRFTHAYDGMKLMVQEPEKVFSDLELTQEEKDATLQFVLRSMRPQAIKVRADVQITCFNSKGIEGVRAALLAAKTVSSEEVPVKIRLIAPPLYVMIATSMEKENGIAALEKAIEIASDTIKAEGGQLEVKMEPRVTSQRDEEKLSSMLEQLEEEAKEVDGDDDDDEEED